MASRETETLFSYTVNKPSWNPSFVPGPELDTGEAQHMGLLEEVGDTSGDGRQTQVVMTLTP